MDLTQLEAFLTLGEELHFGRTAQRLYLSQPRVSRVVSALEREIGAPLFDRTSRRVRLTPLGARLHQRLRACQRELRAALEDARTAAREATGVLRIGFTQTTGGEALNRLVKAVEAAQPDCHVQVHEVVDPDMYGPLRRGEIDVFVMWLAVDEPDLTVGPVIEYQDRVLAVAADDRLADRDSVSIEELAGRPVGLPRPALPAALHDAIVPPFTRSGRSIPRVHPIRSMGECWALVAAGRIVHPTMSSMSAHLHRPDMRLVPIRDLPAMPLGLIWCTAHENARIRACAEAAVGLAAQPTSDLAELLPVG